MKASEMKIFVMVILLGLSLLTALTLESHMKAGYSAELVLIVIGIILTAGILFGLWIDEPWTYPLTTLIFAASLANLVWLFTETQVFLTFAFGLLVNVAGLVMCLISMEKNMPWHELETYEVSGKKKKK